MTAPRIVAGEVPVALLVPPDLPLLAPASPMPMPMLAARLAEPGADEQRRASPAHALLGAAAVDRSGRLRDRALFAALGWRAETVP